MRETVQNSSFWGRLVPLSMAPPGRGRCQDAPSKSTPLEWVDCILFTLSPVWTSRQLPPSIHINRQNFETPVPDVWVYSQKWNC